MSVYIKGMEMPTNCAQCACCDDDARYCHAAHKYIPMIGRPNFCPLVEVKEPHGRLIDVDSLYESMSKWGAGVGDGILADAIQDTPVVIQECP